MISVAYLVPTSAENTLVRYPKLSRCPQLMKRFLLPRLEPGELGRMELEEMTLCRYDAMAWSWTKGEKFRQKKLMELGRTLSRERMRTVVEAAPLFTEEERGFLSRRGMFFPDGEAARRASIDPATEQVMMLLEGELHRIPVVVLGADRPLGQAWAKRLAGRANEMVLVGEKSTPLQKLAQELLEKTGLAAQLRTRDTFQMRGWATGFLAAEGYDAEAGQFPMNSWLLDLTGAYARAPGRAMILSGGVYAHPSWPDWNRFSVAQQYKFLEGFRLTDGEAIAKAGFRLAGCYDRGKMISFRSLYYAKKVS
ncbi:hypothetical protein [Gehongia tenuis]|uniref:Uncharacterized protein n=1 Tax=Gehongia tenuis TaxID=2763655 RepID=A0A926HLQ5_9FIRM|nr:hypothetical protein [Gehongia tenuis]MBC8532337.1 hypothetical protein [Gehongia tenuis]